MQYDSHDPFSRATLFPGAKSYVLQCAGVLPGQERAWAVVYTGGKFTSAPETSGAGEKL